MLRWQITIFTLLNWQLPGQQRFTDYHNHLTLCLHISAVLVIEYMALYMLGKNSTTELYLQNFLLMFILSQGLNCQGLTWTLFRPVAPEFAILLPQSLSVVCWFIFIDLLERCGKNMPVWPYSCGGQWQPAGVSGSRDWTHTVSLGSKSFSH